MTIQEPYKIGKIVKKLAEERGIYVVNRDVDYFKEIDMLDYLNYPLSKPGMKEWLMHRTTRENEVIFEGINNDYHILYGGNRTLVPSILTSEGVYISTPNRIITIVRGIRAHPNYIEVIDRKAEDILRRFRTMTGSPDHLCDGRFRGSIGFSNEDIPRLREALGALI